MADSQRSRLDRLEIMFSEQEYTVQALSETIARQDRDISRLLQSLDLLNDQLRSLRAEFGVSGSDGNEKPPHY